MKKNTGKEVAVVQQVSIESIIQNAIDKGTPVDVMERLLAMRQQLKAEAAKEAYDRSMATLQSELPIIKKTKPIIVDGREIYRYEPVEGIVSQTKEAIQRNGFSYKFKQNLKEGSVEVVCVVTHELGHSEETPMEVRLGQKTRLMSDSQQDAAASTFAKRYAFCNAFGILTGDDDTDARDMAQHRPPMTPYQVPRKVAAEDDEAQGHRGKGYEYPAQTSKNDASGLPKREPAKDTVIIKELLSQLGKPATSAKEAIMFVTILTGGLGKGLKWVPGTNDEEIIQALREVLMDKKENEQRLKEEFPNK